MIFVLIFLLFAGLYVFLLCPRFSARKEISHYKKVRFAHRGYHCHEHGIPENSMAAFRAAVQKGYGIELDIHLTGDGKLVVFHDNNLQRMCSAPGVIEDMTYGELLAYPLLHTQERIPLLTEVLSYVDAQVPILIELKIPTPSLKICEAAYQVLQNYKGAYLVQSFNTMGIRWFKCNAPGVLRGQLSSNLLKSKSKESALLKLLVKYLLINFLGRPDFISYKLTDLPSINVLFLQRLLKTPVGVWTLRTEQALKRGIQEYDFQIFEKQQENY